MIFILKRVWGILEKNDKKKLIIVLFLTIIMAFIDMLGVLSIVPFLTTIASTEMMSQNPILVALKGILGADNYKDFVIKLGSLTIFIVMFSTCLKIFNKYYINRFSNLQRHYLSTRLLKKYLSQNYIFFVKNKSSNLTKNILSEVDQIVNGIINPILSIISYTLILVFIGSLVFFYEPIVALISLFFLFISYFILYKTLNKKIKNMGEENRLINQQKYKLCHEVLLGIKDVKINGLAKKYIHNYNYNSRAYAENLAKNSMYSSIPQNLIELVGYIGLIVLSISLVIILNDIEKILPILGLYGFAAYRMLPAAQNIYKAFSQLNFTSNVFGKISEDFDLLENNHNIKRKNIDFYNHIEFKNIYYSYDSKNIIFNNFNMVVKKNTFIGVVGKSGCGKSTFLDLISGLLFPDSGEILVDGVELNSVNIDFWRQKIGYVPQNVYLFDSSIAENIAFSSDNDIDMNLVISAAKKANIDSFIVNELEDGYQTKVGEQGVRLSGGQRQRIGIARALYKNPELILMDEATSALDNETASIITQNLKELSFDKTVIIIAHRKEALIYCDEIIDFGVYK